MENTNESCKFQIAWIGKCKEPALENGMCEKHKDLKCSSCGAPATHECSETGQFVCGFLLCDDCEHTICESGTNGNIGFFRTSPLPEGMKEHCKKSEQKHFSWLVTSFAEKHPEASKVLARFKNGEITYVEADKQILDFCTEFCTELNKKDL